MSRSSHRFDPEALAEYEEATRYYATQGAGLGLRFIACVEKTIARVCETPGRWRVFAGDEVRRAPVKVFPYGVLYVAEPDHVLILAVAHHRRAPGYWQHRQR